MPAHVVSAIAHMLILKNAILRDVDPVTEFILLIVRLVSVMTVLLPLFNPKKSSDPHGKSF